MTRLVVMGGGHMGHALVGGLLRSGWVAPGDIAIVEISSGRRDELQARFPGVVVQPKCIEADSGVLAVKPSDAEEAARALAANGVPRVLSIVAGVTIASLDGWLSGKSTVLRAMPNMPAVLGAGASALAGGKTVT